MGRVKIAWMSDWDTWGNGKGYSNHNAAMREQAVKLGAELVHKSDVINGQGIAIDIIVPTTYEPVPTAFNVLFTMYEMDRIPQDWIPQIQKADLIIVPCKQNQELFKRYTDKPVDVCQEGVDPAVYHFIDRKPPAKDEYFNFLWVGASNPRKGYELLCAAWELWITSQPSEIVKKTRLIMKTTKAGDDQSVKNMFGCIIDNRKLSLDELIQLYRKSHAFILPSMGEGWGLTLCEAQATGLPCIYTPWSGPNDFMVKEYAYPLKFQMGWMKAVKGKDVYHQGLVAKADILHIVRRMEQIYYSYDEALRRGKLGAEHIANNFTWDKAGERLMEILDNRFTEWKGGK